MSPVSLTAKIILFTMGWSFIDNDLFNQLTKHDRSVMVFSHTSYVDFYILVLYILAYPKRLHRVRTLIKPQPFEYAGSILKYLGAIPSTRVEDKDGGAVNRIVSELNSLKQCIFLISPKGTIIKRPWRSGYYHIAKQLGAKLLVTGLDYEKKCIIVSPSYSCNDYSESSIQTILQSHISDIVPLFPDEEVVPIRSHDPNKRTIINNQRLALVLGGCIIAYIAYSR